MRERSRRIGSRVQRPAERLLLAQRQPDTRIVGRGDERAFRVRDIDAVGGELLAERLQCVALQQRVVVRKEPCDGGSLAQQAFLLRLDHGFGFELFPFDAQKRFVHELCQLRFRARLARCVSGTNATATPTSISRARIGTSHNRRKRIMKIVRLSHPKHTPFCSVFRLLPRQIPASICYVEGIIARRKFAL